jgi:hypothetical protein
VTATLLALISAAIIQQTARAQTSTVPGAIPGVLPEEQQQQEPQTQTQQPAASNVTTDFLTYENPDYELKIRYPSNWDVKEYPNRISFSDALSAPLDKAHLVVDTKPAEKVLDPNDLQTKFKTAQQYAMERVTLLTGPYSLGGYKFFRNESSAIAGNPAWRLDYASGFQGTTYYVVEYYLVKDGRLFTLSYDDDALDVPQTFPIVQKMIDSLQFTKLQEQLPLINTTKTNSSTSVLTYETSEDSFRINYPANYSMLSNGQQQIRMR